MTETFPCLVCGKSLREVLIDGFVIEACLDGCGGIWFDQGELTRLNTPGKGTGDTALPSLLAFPKTGGKTQVERRCPRCKTKLKERLFRANSGIHIDECYGCGGIWLDGGELQAIRENPQAQKAIQDLKEEALKNGIVSPGLQEQMEMERIGRTPVRKRTPEDRHKVNQKARTDLLGHFFLKLFTD